MDLYTPDDIAKMLKVSVGTVWSYIRSGKLPASKLGRKYIISNEQLKRFLDQQEVKPEQNHNPED